ncbi:STAS domain-containing protein [Peribacillus acanthi]|uniref:STAS domain-containing protein n=1 Tax=Peribacillus acanthi TaxID=2171554 RepID=UPI000D3E6668|nr:STAS domain-containing protein [Peribacillus acanthi]
MGNQFRVLGEKLLAKKFDIAKNVHEDRLSELPAEQRALIPRAVEENIINIRAGFISLFGETLFHGLDRETAFANIDKWGKNTGEIIFKMGAPLDAALKDTQYYRIHLWRTLKNEMIDINMTAKDVFDLGEILDPLLDQAAYSFSLTYIHSYQKTLEAAKSAFVELSVPVVQLTKGVAILPLIGNIDTERAQLLMEQTLKEAERLQLSHLLMDLSGVAIVDTMVADQLFKVIASLRLLGVETTLTGLRPEIAQTVVNIGVEFKNILIKGNLKQALNDLDLF